MNRISRSIRVLTAAAALTITLAVFHSVASLARPTAIEQLAQAKKAAVTVASAQQIASRPRYRPASVR
jgi:hypothetical protein